MISDMRLVLFMLFPFIRLAFSSPRSFHWLNKAKQNKEKRISPILIFAIHYLYVSALVPAHSLFICEARSVSVVLFRFRCAVRAEPHFAVRVNVRVSCYFRYLCTLCAE